jgi:hypothetical protein
MANIPKPIKGDARSSIALIAGLDTDFDGEYNPIHVGVDGRIRSEMFFWNSDTLAWEAVSLESMMGTYPDYELSDIEIGEDGDPSYYGHVDADENWYIEKVTETEVRFKKGSGDYVTNWTNRADPPYSYYFDLIW